MYITQLKELEEFVSRAKTSPFLAIDSEFIRENTYRPKLCILQIATADEIVIVDYHEKISLEPLISLLTDENIVKIFHGGTQDIEILFHITGAVPSPVFDTQIANALCSSTLQASYASLVGIYCNASLDKSCTLSDWERRPLTKEQIKYAQEDVRYLPEIYTAINDRLKKLGRDTWLKAEVDAVLFRNDEDVLPENRYKKLKKVSILNSRQLACARFFAAWREKTAMQRNVPRRWLLPDEQIVEACKLLPRNVDQLYSIRGMAKKISLSDAREIITGITADIDAPKETWPLPDVQKQNEASLEPVLAMLNSLLQLKSKQHSIALRMLATTSELSELARGNSHGSRLLKGWRGEIIGEDMMRLLNGEISLSIRNSNIIIVENNS